MLGSKIPLMVSPDAQLKYLKLGSGAFDSDLITIAENFVEKDSVVWDVGANVGVFTFAAASIAKRGTVVSIEADVWLANLLGKTRRLPVYRNLDIRILPVALFNQDGIAVFKIADRGRASNSLEKAGGLSQMGGVRERQYVPSLRMDTLLEEMPAPDFVKIDVEGAEKFVLEGADKILAEVTPVFYIEVSSVTRDVIMEIMAKHGYVAYSPKGERLDSNWTANVFLVPQARIDAFERKCVSLGEIS